MSLQSTEQRRWWLCQTIQQDFSPLSLPAVIEGFAQQGLSLDCGPDFLQLFNAHDGLQCLCIDSVLRLHSLLYLCCHAFSICNTSHFLFASSLFLCFHIRIILKIHQDSKVSSYSPTTEKNCEVILPTSSACWGDVFYHQGNRRSVYPYAIHNYCYCAFNVPLML